MPRFEQKFAPLTCDRPTPNCAQAGGECPPAIIPGLLESDPVNGGYRLYILSRSRLPWKLAKRSILPFSASELLVGGPSSGLPLS